MSVVTFRSRKTRFRLAALPCRAGFEPAELLILVSVLLGYMTHLQDEAFSWRTRRSMYVGTELDHGPLPWHRRAGPPITKTLEIRRSSIRRAQSKDAARAFRRAKD